MQFFDFFLNNAFQIFQKLSSLTKVNLAKFHKSINSRKFYANFARIFNLVKVCRSRKFLRIKSGYGNFKVSKQLNLMRFDLIQFSC